VRHAAALVALLAVAAGCGGGGRANDALSDTASNLGKIRSGDLTLRLIVSPREGTKGRIGFELRGPFALRTGSLPIAKITYTQIAGARKATATFISTGRKAYAEIDGKAYELPPDATAVIRQAGSGAAGRSNALGQFQIGSWFKNPHAIEGGASTDHVAADLDVVAAANGLLGFVRELGRETPRIEGDSADQLKDAVESSRIQVWSGKKDHLLRRLLLNADLGLDVPESLRRVLGEVVGAKVDFELAVANPNHPIDVAPPLNPLPSSALPSG
jgi:hypothetical protein